MIFISPSFNIGVFFGMFVPWWGSLHQRVDAMHLRGLSTSALSVSPYSFSAGVFFGSFVPWTPRVCRGLGLPPQLPRCCVCIDRIHFLGLSISALLSLLFIQCRSFFWYKWLVSGLSTQGRASRVDELQRRSWSVPSWWLPHTCIFIYNMSLHPWANYPPPGRRLQPCRHLHFWNYPFFLNQFRSTLSAPRRQCCKHSLLISASSPWGPPD
jgi:hypothetical protein